MPGTNPTGPTKLERSQRRLSIIAINELYNNRRDNPQTRNKGGGLTKKQLAQAGNGRDLITKDLSGPGNGRDLVNKGTPVAAPPVMSPGSGLAGASTVTSAASVGIPAGGGVPAGKVPTINTSLHTDSTGALKRAQNAAGLEYDPQIAAIRGLIDQANKSGTSNIQKTGDMYATLQKTLQGQIAPVDQNFDNTQASTQAAYAALQAQIAAGYDATKSSNTAEFARLGISQADPTNQKLTRDEQFLQGIAGLQGTGQNNALELQQKGADVLFQGNAQRAGFEGANRKADLQTQLADKIMQLKTQQGTVNATKGKAIRELQDQYKQEALAQAERDRAFGLNAAQFNEGVLKDRRNFKQGQETSQANLALSAQKNQAAAQAAANKASQVDLKSLDPQEKAAYKAEQLVPGSGNKLFAYLQDLVNSNKDVRRGFRWKVVNGKNTQIKITSEEFGALAARAASATGLPKGSVQKIASAYWSEMKH